MRKRTVVLAIAVLAAGLLVASLAAAGDGGKKNFTVGLSSYEEVPAVSSNGFGTLTATIDDEAQTITYELTYGGLNAPASASHIHFGQRTANGGVVAFLCGGDGKPVCPPDGGTVSGVITPENVRAAQGILAGEFEEFVQAIRAGVTYANVHTSAHPGGEIRGQINDADQRG